MMIIVVISCCVLIATVLLLRRQRRELDRAQRAAAMLDEELKETLRVTRLERDRVTLLRREGMRKAKRLLTTTQTIGMQQSFFGENR